MVAIVLSIYGGYSMLYNLNHKKPLSILGVVFFIVGAVMLAVLLVLIIISAYKQSKKRVDNEAIEAEQIEEQPEPQVEEPAAEEKKEELAVEKETTPIVNSQREDVEYEPRRTTRSFSGGSGYVKRVGYGPVLRVEEEEILDMRTNTYYRIEGNMVKRVGSGPLFEINGNSIRDAFGGYLFEISGGNVNKTFGGYFASINSGSIQVYDLSERYEITGSLNLKQQLAIVAILFANR